MDGLLIEKVKQYALLYNIKSSDYHNQRMRQLAWEEIAQDLGISAEDAKVKWTKLRKQFCRTIQRSHTRKARIISAWKFERQMNFLLPFVDKGSAPSNIEGSSSQVNAVEEYRMLDEQEEEKENVNPSKYLNEEEENSELITQNEHRETFQNHAMTKANDSTDKILQIIKKCTEIREIQEAIKLIQPPLLSISDLDDTDMLFLSMSKTIQKLPKTQQSEIKFIIHKFVLEAERNNHEIQQKSYAEQLHPSQQSSNTFLPHGIFNSLQFSPDDIARFPSTKME